VVHGTYKLVWKECGNFSKYSFLTLSKPAMFLFSEKNSAGDSVYRKMKAFMFQDVATTVIGRRNHQADHGW
jgi:hypothetical protein